MSRITVVGLGPGDPGLLTRAAWEVLSRADSVYVRTTQHPTVAALPSSVKIHSFDHIYDHQAHFGSVYEAIVDHLVAIARHGGYQEVLYAVPGDPTVGETTTWLLRTRAAKEGLSVHVLHGVSFLEPTLLALGLDPLEEDGLQIVDAMVVAGSHVPPFDTAHPALLAQCYNRAMASDVKLTLLPSYGPEHLVTVVQHAGLVDQSTRDVALHELDRSPAFDHLTVVYVPPASRYGSFSRLQEIVAHLRAPDGCPWDREQTLPSLRRDLMEEVFELLEALDALDDKSRGAKELEGRAHALKEPEDQKLEEELGDTALVIAMLAQIAVEEERLLWPQVMEAISQKLIRRHPHVFGDLAVSSASEVLANWARIKDQERQTDGGQQPGSPLASVPRSLPALALARKYLSRLERMGLEPVLDEANVLGVALWHLVAQARVQGDDAEIALRMLCHQVAAAAETEWASGQRD